MQTIDGNTNSLCPSVYSRGKGNCSSPPSTVHHQQHRGKHRRFVSVVVFQRWGELFPPSHIDDGNYLVSGSRGNYWWNANFNALLINVVYYLIFLLMKSRTNNKKSGGFLENFSAKWKFLGVFTKGITNGLIKNNII
jgi:hypothetical protein